MADARPAPLGLVLRKEKGKASSSCGASRDTTSPSLRGLTTAVISMDKVEQFFELFLSFFLVCTRCPSHLRFWSGAPSLRVLFSGTA